MSGAAPATNTLGFRWSAVNNLLVTPGDIASPVAYDAASARVAITFRPTGIATLAAEDAARAAQGEPVESQVEEVAA